VDAPPIPELCAPKGRLTPSSSNSYQLDPEGKAVLKVLIFSSSLLESSLRTKHGAPRKSGQPLGR
jgi:hypothetical protein